MFICPARPSSISAALATPENISNSPLCCAGRIEWIPLMDGVRQAIEPGGMAAKERRLNVEQALFEAGDMP